MRTLRSLKSRNRGDIPQKDPDRSPDLDAVRTPVQVILVQVEKAKDQPVLRHLVWGRKVNLALEKRQKTTQKKKKQRRKIVEV